MASDITYEIQGRSYTGYLADGSGGKPSPGVLVIHEANGLGDHARRKADMLAEAGYVAFATDLYGEVADTLDDAMKLAGPLMTNPDELRTRCKGALDVLRRQSNVDSGKLAAIGFCFGGSAALELGRSGADLRAIVGFHSGLKTSRPEDTAAIKAKLLLCLGDADPLIPGDVRDAFMDNVREAKLDAQMILYSGVGHSFTNPEAERFGVAGCHYDANADRRSWAAMRALFDEVFA